MIGEGGGIGSGLKLDVYVKASVEAEVVVELGLRGDEARVGKYVRIGEEGDGKVETGVKVRVGDDDADVDVAGKLLDKGGANEENVAIVTGKQIGRAHV